MIVFPFFYPHSKHRFPPAYYLVEKISEKIYGNAPEIKEEFDAKMEKYHMEKAEVTPQSEKTTKKFENTFGI